MKYCPNIWGSRSQKTAFLNILKQSQKNIQTLSEMGIKIALDDFGTGYSSLSHLKNLPIKIVKIDRSFVKDIPQDENQMALCKGLLYLAKNLNIEVVAEGIENKTQMGFFKKLGCNYAQGYFYCKAYELWGV